MTRLEARTVTVERGGRRLIEGISLELRGGTVHAVIGRNGSGKSTLLRVLAGLWPPAEGEVRLDGQALGGMPRAAAARRIAYVPQDTHLDFAFTVAETIAMGRHPHRGRFAAESAADRQAIERAAKLCDVRSLWDRTVDTLSGGERQRVLIARAIAATPDFVLLDEPTANLDPAHALEVLHLCASLADTGHAVALATHDLNAVARTASHVALLDAGRLLASGPRDEVLRPSTLESLFGVRAEHLTAADGQPVYLFHRRQD